ncbi:iron-sulfur cluster carrier protein ApbC [Vreelandella malpeensis]|uniref:Iron-sulfur cluster carrier protein n=1 Tax=Vreelandella malpeensis TaxID=1172368 RepID=A0ABS8DVJ1_9GAMM|nr:iron-sulfur cluster carrier protein ApbC [Halomonas malpeensis]MCB8890347.1 iron-sulfur cluster carrier protein ApbC [Halomonas malpeensis]
MEGIKHIVAVASGKGGVGKSTVTVNLALALSAQGYRVGVLDADIYGPSQAQMLGVAEGTRPQTVGENTFLPLEAHGLQAMSMAFLVNSRDALVWRGPMVVGAFQQMLNQTKWDDLDFLLIDMPPGTGDIQLTLAQKVPVSGAVVVTTPQDIALLDARKGIEMFRKVKVPVVGVVENMSLYTCEKCGHEATIFGAGGGERIADEYNTALLGRLPLTLDIRELADSGTPSVIAKPESAESQAFADIARQVAQAVMGTQQSGPTISFSE